MDLLSNQHFYHHLTQSFLTWRSTSWRVICKSSVWNMQSSSLIFMRDCFCALVDFMSSYWYCDEYVQQKDMNRLQIAEGDLLFAMLMQTCALSLAVQLWSGHAHVCEDQTGLEVLLFYPDSFDFQSKQQPETQTTPLKLSERVGPRRSWSVWGEQMSPRRRLQMVRNC